MKWRHWRDECQKNYEEQKFSINANLETVVRVNNDDCNVHGETFAPVLFSSHLPLLSVDEN